jgi:hypothetical protein
MAEYPDNRFTVWVTIEGLFPRAAAEKYVARMGFGAVVYELIPASDMDAVRALIAAFDAGPMSHDDWLHGITDAFDALPPALLKSCEEGT